MQCPGLRHPGNVTIVRLRQGCASSLARRQDGSLIGVKPLHPPQSTSACQWLGRSSLATGFV